MAAADDLLIHRLVRAVNKSTDLRIAAAGKNGGLSELATVKSIEPLVILRDGSTTTTPAYALSSYSPRTVGDRVLVHMLNKQPIVLGTEGTPVDLGGGESIASLGGAGVETLGDALSTLDGSGDARNTIDDGAGNATIVGDLIVEGYDGVTGSPTGSPPTTAGAYRAVIDGIPAVIFVLSAELSCTIAFGEGTLEVGGSGAEAILLAAPTSTVGDLSVGGTLSTNGDVNAGGSVSAAHAGNKAAYIGDTGGGPPSFDGVNVGDKASDGAAGVEYMWSGSAWRVSATYT